MDKQYINELKAGIIATGPFLVAEKAMANFTQANRSGEQFLRMQLVDASGTIKGVIWDNASEVAKCFAVGDVIHINGTLTYSHD